MNVYDFDGTIYDGDSTLDFYLFSIKRNPRLLMCIPKQFWAVIKYKLHKIDKTAMKENFFIFLSKINVEELVSLFWKNNEGKIYKWYIEQQRDNDIIISASPEFLLKPICDKLGIQYLIASRVDVYTGKFYGKNCRGEEKVKRLKHDLGIEHVNSFYSDSFCDLPMARIADTAYIVRKGVIEQWDIK